MNEPEEILYWVACKCCKWENAFEATSVLPLPIELLFQNFKSIGFLPVYVTIEDALEDGFTKEDLQPVRRIKT